MKIKDLKPKINAGMSMTETVIAISIFLAVSVSVWNFGRDIFFFNSGLNDSLNSQFYSRQVLKKIVSEIRKASPSSLGAYPLALTSTSSVIFYANIDDDVYKEQIRYFLQNKILKRGVIKPSGNPLVYNAEEEVFTTVAENVANGSAPIFEYFNRNVTSTSTPMNFPVDILAVRLVKITLIIDKDPNRPPPLFTATTQVMLRNLKDNL